MSFIDPSMESMLDMFIYESTTLLLELDEIMMESEKSNGMNEKNINEIFRIMHTIKGSAAMMGLESISNLAHAVEDVFYYIRETPAKLDIISDSIYDLLFHASDFIKAEIDNIPGESYAPADSSGMIRELEAQVDIMNGKTPPPAPVMEAPAEVAYVAPEPEAEPVSAPPAAAPVELDENAMHQVRVFFEDGCQMENIRSFMLLTQLKDWCDDLESEPDHPENDSSVSNEIIEHGLLIKFRTSGSPKDIYNVIENAINVKYYEIIEDQAATSETRVSSVSVDRPAAESASAAAATVVVATSVASPAEEVRPEYDAVVEPAAAVQGKAPVKQSLISVNQTKLDQLMDLVGELVTAESIVASNPDLKGLVLDNFTKSTRELRKLTDELQDVVMSIRMVPLSGVFQKMNRIIRDMGKKLGKQVELVTNGGDTEVDKTINDAITDPFMHMIRNAMDHAIEPLDERRQYGKPDMGTVTMSAQNVGGEIVITIADDGRGLDRERIIKKARNNGMLTKAETDYSDKEVFGMIMLPGFSTNEAVTEYSGRGVGMDVVRKNVEKLGGTITVDSSAHLGTTFTIKIPLTLAIVDGMEISVGDTIFTLPITSIKQSFKIFDQKQVIVSPDGAEMIMLRGDCYPIIRLHQLFSIETPITNLTDGIVIQIEDGSRVGCIFADELIGEQQVVVKPFPGFLNRYNIKGGGLSGCTILGDGSISLIVDANNLLNVYER